LQLAKKCDTVRNPLLGPERQKSNEAAEKARGTTRTAKLEERGGEEWKGEKDEIFFEEP
jgi:hypothetical protein